MKRRQDGQNIHMNEHVLSENEKEAINQKLKQLDEIFKNLNETLVNLSTFTNIITTAKINKTKIDVTQLKENLSKRKK